MKMTINFELDRHSYESITNYFFLHSLAEGMDEKEALACANVYHIACNVTTFRKHYYQRELILRDKLSKAQTDVERFVYQEALRLYAGLLAPHTEF